MKIAVMGAGAVGAYFGGMLAQAGYDVTLIARPNHVNAINARGGITIESKAFNKVIPLHATSDASGVNDAEIVLFCVKSADTETTAAAMLPHLAPHASVISLQNGVDNAERLSAILKRGAIAAVVYVATEMAAPGHVRHHGRGDLIIGASGASAAIAERFTAAGIPTQVSNAVREALWDKLIINCVYNALSAIPNLPYRDLLAMEGVDEIIRNVIAECKAVADALGVAVAPDIYERTMALGTAMPGQYSSTAQDLARGKRSEIDFLNGYVVRQGRAHGIPTPTNLTLQVLVKLREVGVVR